MTLILRLIFQNRIFIIISPERCESTGTENLALGSGHTTGHVQLDVKLAESRVQFEKVGREAELGLFQPGGEDRLTANGDPSQGAFQFEDVCLLKYKLVRH